MVCSKTDCAAVESDPINRAFQYSVDLPVLVTEIDNVVVSPEERVAFNESGATLIPGGSAMFAFTGIVTNPSSGSFDVKVISASTTPGVLVATMTSTLVL